MIENPTLRNLLTANIKIDEYDPAYRKIILSNLFLFITSVALFFFTFYNLFVTSVYSLALMDAVACLVAMYGLYDLRKTKILFRAALIGTANLFIFLCALVIFYKGDDFTLIWTIFLPIFAILVNGSKKGLLITVAFYAIVFTVAYQGTGTWLDGQWNSASYLRFLLASVVLTYLIYSFEQSMEKAFIALSAVREREKKHMGDLEKLSVTDPLTTLYNRRHLNTLFRRNFRVAKLYDHFFALFVLDLDHFKQYNDLYGHQMGDYVLQEVAQVLLKHMKREADAAFRLGGEEFSGLIMSDGVEKIMESVEAIRKDIEGLQITHEGNMPEKVVTASFGVCIIDAFEHEDFDAMYKIADDALYRAKDEGRNRVLGGLTTLETKIPQ